MNERVPVGNPASILGESRISPDGSHANGTNGLHLTESSAASILSGEAATVADLEPEQLHHLFAAVRKSLGDGKTDKRLRMIRTGVAKAETLSDFVVLGWFAQERYRETDAFVSEVLHRRKKDEEANNIYLRSIDPYGEQGPEAIDIVAAGLEDNLKKQYDEPHRLNEHFVRSLNQITYLKGQLTQARKVTQILEHPRKHGFHTRKVAEVYLQLHKRRQWNTYQRMTTLLGQAQEAYAAAHPEPIPIADPIVAEEIIVVPATQPVMDILSLVPVLKKSEPKKLPSEPEAFKKWRRREVLATIGQLVFGNLAIQTLVALPIWIRHNPEKVEAAKQQLIDVGEETVFQGSTRVIDKIGRFLAEQFPAPKGFPFAENPIVLEADSPRETVPQLVSECLNDRTAVEKGLKELFFAGQFKPVDEDVFWPSEIDGYCKDMASRVISYAAQNAKTDRIDELNYRTMRTAGADTRPRDVAYEFIRFFTEGNAGSPCKLCGPQEQRKRFAVVSARRWYADLYNKARSERPKLTQVLDRLSPPEWLTESVSNGDMATSVVERYLSRSLGETERNSQIMPLLVNWLARGQAGLMRIRREAQFISDFNQLSIGDEILFDPRLVDFIRLIIEQDDAGELSVASLVAHFSAYEIPSERWLSGDVTVPRGDILQQPAGSLTADYHLGDSIKSGKVSIGQPVSYEPGQTTGQHAGNEKTRAVLEKLLARSFTRRGIVQTGLVLPIMAHTASPLAKTIREYTNFLEVFDQWSAEFVSEVNRRFQSLFRPNPVNYSTVITDAVGNPLAYYHPEGRPSYKIDEEEEIPASIRDALVATENKHFFEDEGVDAAAIARALFGNMSGGVMSGASTITQQLIRMVAYSGEERRAQQHSDVLRKERKAIELVLAPTYETNLEERLGSKERAKEYIMRQFLNVMEFGKPVGVKAAARHYFGEELGSISLAQSAALVGMLQRPGDYSRSAQLASNRAKSVLSLMEKAGKITPHQKALATEELNQLQFVEWEENDPHYFGYHNPRTWHFTEGVLADLGENKNRGLSVETSIDPVIQNIVWKTAQAEIGKYRGRYGMPINAAVVVVDPNGNILGHLGNIDVPFDVEKQSTEWVSLDQMERSPGSILKPFLAALKMSHSGVGGDYPLTDGPYEMPGANPGQIHVVHNFKDKVWDAVHYGKLILAKAIGNSLDPVFVRMLAEEVGVEPYADALDKVGISSLKQALQKNPDGPNELAILGPNVGVSTMQLARAYTSIFNHGLLMNLRAVRTIHSGKKSYAQPISKGIPVLSKAVAEEMATIMSDRGNSEFGFGRRFLNSLLGEDVAFKTGTSDGPKDVRIVTRDNKTGLMVVVWVGNPDGRDLPDEFVAANNAGVIAGNIIAAIRKTHDRHGKAIQLA